MDQVCEQSRGVLRSSVGNILRRLTAIGIGIALSTTCAVAEINEPLAARDLTPEEIVSLIERRPVWCEERSPDGLSCRSITMVTQVHGKRVAMSRFYQNEINGRNGIGKSTTLFALQPDGLCTKGRKLIDHFDWSAAQEPLRIKAYRPNPKDASVVEKYRETLTEYFAFVAKHKKLGPEDTVCVRVSQVGNGHQKFAFTSVYAVGTDHQAVELPWKRDVFEALTSDPGLTLRR